MKAWEEKGICKNYIQPVEVKGPVKKLKTEGWAFYFVTRNFWNNIAFLMKEYFNTSTEMWGG